MDHNTHRIPRLATDFQSPSFFPGLDRTKKEACWFNEVCRNVLGETFCFNWIKNVKPFWLRFCSPDPDGPGYTTDASAKRLLSKGPREATAFWVREGSGVNT